MCKFTSISSHRTHRSTHTRLRKIVAFVWIFSKEFVFFAVQMCCKHCWWLVGWLVCFVHWICIASCMSWICQCHHHYHHDKGGGVVLISLFLPFFFIFFSFLFVVLRVERGVTIKCHSFIFGVTTWFEDPSFAYDLKLG